MVIVMKSGLAIDVWLGPNDRRQIEIYIIEDNLLLNFHYPIMET